ncbi:MAG: hypothetical protein PHV42_01615 [Candidatus Pacebacteria bacterium]|nr:hypothetical protein [Candidatus Paceibacterota bacterium]
MRTFFGKILLAVFLGFVPGAFAIDLGSTQVDWPSQGAHLVKDAGYGYSVSVRVDQSIGATDAQADLYYKVWGGTGWLVAYVETIGTTNTFDENGYGYIQFEPDPNLIDGGQYFVRLIVSDNSKGGAGVLGSIDGGTFTVINPPTITGVSSEIVAPGETIDVNGFDFQEWGNNVVIESQEVLGVRANIEFLPSYSGNVLSFEIPKTMYLWNNGVVEKGEGGGDVPPIPVGTTAGVYKLTVYGPWGGQDSTYITVVYPGIIVFPLALGVYSPGNTVLVSYATDGLSWVNMGVTQINKTLPLSGNFAGGLSPDGSFGWTIPWDMNPGMYQISVTKSDGSVGAFTTPFTILPSPMGIVPQPTNTVSGGLVITFNPDGDGKPEIENSGNRYALDEKKGVKHFKGGYLLKVQDRQDPTARPTTKSKK